MALKFIYSAEVIEQFKKKHEERYDYGRVDYKNNHTKVIIICKKHGEFSQIPKDHKQGTGCPKCSGTKQLNTAEVIEQFKKKHEERYDYGKVDYKGTHTKVIIICKEHGEFSQAPASHKQGKGCPSCSSSSSKNEVLCFMALKFIYSKCIVQTQVERNGLSYDILIQSKSKETFIEWDGVYYHRDRKTDRKTDDKKKTECQGSLINIEDPAGYNVSFVRTSIRDYILPTVRNK